MDLPTLFTLVPSSKSDNGIFYRVIFLLLFGVAEESTGPPQGPGAETKEPGIFNQS